MGDGDRNGRTRSAADAQIAAVARRHNLTLATRNLKDFGSMKVMLFDPWSNKSKSE
jgi:predicted nucleic acid-binding protein